MLFSSAKTHPKSTSLSLSAICWFEYVLAMSQLAQGMPRLKVVFRIGLKSLHFCCCNFKWHLCRVALQTSPGVFHDRLDLCAQMDIPKTSQLQIVKNDDHQPSWLSSSCEIWYSTKYASHHRNDGMILLEYQQHSCSVRTSKAAKIIHRSAVKSESSNAKSSSATVLTRDTIKLRMAKKSWPKRIGRVSCEKCGRNVLQPGAEKKNKKQSDQLQSMLLAKNDDMFGKKKQPPWQTDPPVGWWSCKTQSPWRPESADRSVSTWNPSSLESRQTAIHAEASFECTS